jgi:protein-disulfide isomerase
MSPRPHFVKRLLPTLIVSTVGLLTVASGTILYRSHRPAVMTISEKDAAGNISKVTHIRGPVKAPVTLEEFGDFQCPPCGMLAGPLKQIEEENKTSVRVIFRHFPFPIHQHAFAAACAAEAADLQGKFWEMHDLLYREQSNWSKGRDARQMFASYAGVLGLNVDRFTTDMNSEEVKSRVENDKKRGTSLGISTTPSLFINNQSVPPSSLNPESLRKLIKEAVSKSGNTGSS